MPQELTEEQKQEPRQVEQGEVGVFMGGASVGPLNLESGSKGMLEYASSS